MSIAPYTTQCSLVPVTLATEMCTFNCRMQQGRPKGTPGNAKCVTEILAGDKNKVVWGTNLPFRFKGW